jgi:ribonucleotide reductase beta subunit family protein with ferritin-like domain
MSEYSCNRPVDFVQYAEHVKTILNEFEKNSVCNSHKIFNFQSLLNDLLLEGSSKNATEPILGGINPSDPNCARYNTELINGKDSTFSEFRLYVEKSITDAWKASDINLANEKADFESATPDLKFIITQTVKFFLPMDSKVGSNTVNNVLVDIIVREIITALIAASHQESTHVYTYTDVAKAIGIYSDVFNNEDPIGKFPFVRLKILWLDLWTNNYVPFRIKILAQKCTEQIHFVSLFIYIYWIEQTYPGKFIGLTSSNKLIAAEESSHGKLASMINNYLVTKPTKEEAHAIIASAVDIEMMCIRDIRTEVEKIVIKHNMGSSAFLQDMSEDDLFTLVKFIANITCKDHGIEVLYPEITHIPKKMSWFHKISLDHKINFFEARNNDYIKVKLQDEELENLDFDNF